MATGQNDDRRKAETHPDAAMPHAGASDQQRPEIDSKPGESVAHDPADPAVARVTADNGDAALSPRHVQNAAPSDREPGDWASDQDSSRIKSHDEQPLALRDAQRVMRPPYGAILWAVILVIGAAIVLSLIL